MSYGAKACNIFVNKFGAKVKDLFSDGRPRDPVNSPDTASSRTASAGLFSFTDTEGITTVLQDPGLYCSKAVHFLLWRNSHEQAQMMLTQWSFHFDMSPEMYVLLREKTLRA